MAAMPAAMPPIWARVRLGLAVAGEVEDGGAVAAIEVEVEVEDEVIDACVGAAVVVAAVDEVEVGVEVGVIAIVVELWSVLDVGVGDATTTEPEFTIRVATNVACVSGAAKWMPLHMPYAVSTVSAAHTTVVSYTIPEEEDGRHQVDLHP